MNATMPTGLIALAALLGFLVLLWRHLALRERALLKQTAGDLDSRLAIDPRNPELLRELAGIEIEQKRFRDAVRHARLAVDVNDGDPLAHELAALAFAGMASHAEAREHANRALELEPKSFRAYLALADVAEAAGEKKAAAESRQKAVDLMFHEETLLGEEEKPNG